MKLKLENLSVSAKIFLPIVGGFVLLVVFFVALILHLEGEKRLVTSNINSTKQAIYLFGQLAEKEKQNELLVTMYRFQPNKGALDTIQQADLAKASILEEASSHVNTEQGKELIKVYVDNTSGLAANRQRLIDAINGRQAEKIDQMFEKWKTQRRYIDAALADVIVYSTSLLDSDTAAFRRVITEIALTYLVILLATAALTITLYFYMRRLIIEPIEQLTLGTKRVTDRDLDWKIETSSSDEIGRLAQAFNEMTQKLRDSYDHLQTLAFSDSLTGLPNRQALQQKLEEGRAEALRNHKLFAVLLLDLDRFKKINDTLGHDIGDKVLRETAGRLLSAVQPKDSVVRFGGGEFVVILTDLEEPHSAVVAASRILGAFGEKMMVGGYELHISCSIGIAIYPNDAEDVSILLKSADIALYGAKAGGRNRYNLYNKLTDLRPAAQLELENDLHAALEKGQLKVFFQPLVSLHSGQVVAVEALLRWQHPHLGLLLPHEFVSLAEEVGLINKIGEWALNVACEQAKGWDTEGLPALNLAVNLSPRQFSEDNLVENVTKVLEKTGFPANRLTLEITENTAMANLERGKEKLQALSRMGITLSIDDFGIGYSSLSYLRDFPVQKLKIDHSFVRHIITDPQDTAIVKAIITMSHNLNLKTAAEGVESDTQMALLKSLGCDEAQGYYISRPLSGEDFRQWLKTSLATGQTQTAASQPQEDLAQNT